MLKVNSLKTPGSAKISHGQGGSQITKSSSSFSTELSEAVSSKNMSDFRDMMDDLADQEKRFLEKRDIEELGKYRSLIQKILSFISDTAFESKELTRFKKTKAPFTVTTVIDSKLIDIASKISSGNKAFSLLKELDEIRGLILDYVK